MRVELRLHVGYGVSSLQGSDVDDITPVLRKVEKVVGMMMDDVFQ